MKKKVVVCGSTFGQFYINALQQLLNEDFELVGLYGKGSDRSRKCAETYGIPLFTEFDQIPEIDFACVVISSGTVGGIGTELACKFMEKKIPVLQEQPIHPRDLAETYRVAKKNGVYFKTCDLYPKLPEVARFIRVAQELNKREKPLYIKAAFGPQVSFPAIDILSRILPSIYSLTVENITECVGPFDILTGKLGDTPITIEYNNQVNTEDRDNHAHLLHNMAIVYETGRLILEDTFGPVLWKPRMYVPKSLYNPENRAEIPPYLKELTMETLGNYKAKDFIHVLFEDWKQGIADNIVEFSKMIDEKVRIAPYAQRELLCSQKWSEITNIFGFAKSIHPKGNEYIPSVEIHKYSDEV